MIMTTPTVKEIANLIEIGYSANLHPIDIANEIHALFCPEIKQNSAKFFEDIKKHFGVTVPESERTAFLIEAGCNVSDLRWVLLKHPDQKMVESSCLHFLGDEAQSWWNSKKRP